MPPEGEAAQNNAALLCDSLRPQPFSLTADEVGEFFACVASHQQAVIETSCTAGITRNLAHGEAIQGEALRRSREKGVHVMSLPDDVLHELARISQEVLEEQAQLNADLGRVLDSQRTVSDDYQGWKRVGFLPRDFE